MTIQEVQLKYTANHLVGLAKNKWGENSTEYLAGLLESVITYNQMKVLVDFLEAERTGENK
jgi:hypothetical protein